VSTDPAIEEAARQLREAAAAKKCWSCGCLHDSLRAVERAFPTEPPPVLDAAVNTARDRLTEVRYDCLGCEVCYPALALNALNEANGERLVDLAACPTKKVEEREGWPPLPGAYTVLRYQAPVAVCTLTDDGLATAVAREAGAKVSIIGALQTENLGIERLITNVLANPNIRFVVVCGADSRQVIGHLPGQSLVALARSGVDDGSRILGARGKRPVLRNVSREAVEHFRQTVEVVDLVGNADVPAILHAVSGCADRNPGAATPFTPDRIVATVSGYLPQRMTSDPAGYFVVDVDRSRRRLSLEHYRTEGVLDTVITGRIAAELYVPAIERGLVSRLDHAAYLGRELARAERALLAGEPYVQDAAPEYGASTPTGCGCVSSRGDATP
jgi:tetrahydromethanopterin S-methyltransferase subunit A